MSRVQATVVIMGPDGAMSLVRDDGQTLHAGAEAVRAGGWRAARPGQRVQLDIDDADGTVRAVLLPTGERT